LTEIIVLTSTLNSQALVHQVKLLLRFATVDVSYTLLHTITDATLLIMMLSEAYIN